MSEEHAAQPGVPSGVMQEILNLQDAPAPSSLLGVPTSLAHAVCQTVAALNPVVKSRNAAQGWDYLSDSEIVAAVRKPMAHAGLFIRPHSWKVVEKEEYTTKNGAQMSRYVLEVIYRLEHTSGQYIDIPMLGEASDSGDKAISKCFTAAYKYALRETFCLTGGQDPDQGDPSRTERAPRAAQRPESRGGRSEQQDQRQEPKKELTPQERYDVAVNAVKNAKDHSVLDSALKKIRERGGFSEQQLIVIATTAQHRRTELFTKEVQKASSLEQIDEIGKKMEPYKLDGTLSDSIDQEVQKRANEILAGQAPASSPGESGGESEDDPEPMIF